MAKSVLLHSHIATILYSFPLNYNVILVAVQVKKSYEGGNEAGTCAYAYAAVIPWDNIRRTSVFVLLMLVLMLMLMRIMLMR